MTQNQAEHSPYPAVLRVAHLTTVDLSLRFLVWPQLLAVVESGGQAFGISSDGPWVAEMEEAGVRHIALRSSTRGVSLVSDIRAAGQLWRELRRTQLTVLHTHNPKPGIYGRILGRLAGVPVVVNTLHGFYATETDPVIKRGLVYTLEAIAARFSDAELHQNPEDLELALRIGIVRRSKSRLLGNGVDLRRFDPNRVSDDARSRIRQTFGAGEQDIVVGTVGRLVAEKGFLELFEVAETLGDGFVFVVVGPVDSDKSDAISPSVVQQAEDNGVRFLGMRTDMEDLYAAMDVFVLPSHREGFPRAAMEASAMGLPVIATDIRGCRQVVENGVNGLLVPVRQVGPLRDAIRQLGEDSELRALMSEASRRIAMERFDESAVVGIVMETYREILESKGLSHLIPAGMMNSERVSEPREARIEDARGLANLHVDLISSGFLPRLGRRFMRVLYRALLDWRGTKAYVVDDAGGLAGFVIGVRDVGSFYGWFLKKRWLAAGFAALPALVNPRNIRRAYESARYGGVVGEGNSSAEVLSLGVVSRARGRGLSEVLLKAVQEGLAEDGCDTVRVVVGSTNSVALGAYEKAGFDATETIEVHKGESSQVLVWRPH